MQVENFSLISKSQLTGFLGNHLLAEKSRKQETTEAEI